MTEDNDFHGATPLERCVPVRTMGNMIPTEIKLKRDSRVLEVTFEDGARFELPCEYLRVFSPSAEVRGHAGGEGRLVAGKRDVSIDRIEPMGNYAVRLHFDDGHHTGIYGWSYLRELGENRETNWARYLERLQAAGMTREA